MRARLVFSAAVFLLTSCSDSYKPPTPEQVAAAQARIDARRAAQPVAREPEPEDHPPAIDIDRLIRDFSDNELLGNQTYKGKRFRFRGTVRDISVVLGDLMVRMGSRSGGLSCYFGKSGGKNPNLNKLRRGQAVVLDGTCRGTGISGAVVFHDCEWPYDEDVQRQTPEMFEPPKRRR